MRLWIVLLALVSFAGCADEPEPFLAGLPPFDLQSPAFLDGGAIPARYTCDSDGISPGLSWHAAWLNASHYALIVDDPDAPGAPFVHWTVWDLADVDGRQAIPAGFDFTRGGGIEGTTSRGDVGYVAPCPPAGSEHRYYFTVYALDAPLGLPAGSDVATLRESIEAHAIGRAVLEGTYAR